VRALPPLLTVLLLAGPAAAGDDWRVGLGPDVFAEPSDGPITRIGGWVDASYEDSDEQPSAGGLNHVNGFADTRYRSLQAFLEVEYERETDLAGYEDEHQVELEQAYLRWRASDAFGVRAGRFNTPFGWWVPIHWSILMDSATPPLHVGKEVVPEQQIGLELAGRLFSDDVLGLDAEANWALFGGWGAEGLDQDRTEGLSFGGDLHLRLAERTLLGVSAYQQRNRELDDRMERSGVVYGEVRLPCALTLRSEYVFSRRSRVRDAGALTALSRDADSVYASLRWDAHRFAYLAYRFGHGEDDDEELFTTDERTVHTFTLGLVPHPSVRVKLEYNHNELSGGARSDFDHWVVSLGYLF
jgi:hypothetical protein